MQRRSAAAYVALFVAVAALSTYAIATGRFAGRSNHFWALAGLSTVAAVVLLASAYMPVRRD